MTTGEILDRTTARLGDTVGSINSYYTRAEILVAVNQVYRLMCFLTLALEATVIFPLTATTAFYKMLVTYADWILPLRIRLSGGAKLLPVRLVDLAALSTTWSVTAGTPERYALLGFDLLCVFKQPPSALDVQIVYARTPATLSVDSDEPEIPLEYHQALIDGAIPLLRIKEGAQEWAKTLESWNRYMDSVQGLGDYVRHRNREQGYDNMPFELARFDRSKLMEVASAR